MTFSLATWTHYNNSIHTGLKETMITVAKTMQGVKPENNQAAEFVLHSSEMNVE
jgi:hypothetical protein